jgi:hypothetical protein
VRHLYDRTHVRCSSCALLYEEANSTLVRVSALW